MWPWVMKLNVAGSTTIPVKIGMNSHTRLTKNDERQPRRGGEHERRRVHARRSTGMLSDERGRDEQAEQRQQLHPRVEALQQAGPRGHVVGEHRLAHQDADAADASWLDEAALPPLADAPARAQADLARQQPPRRGRSAAVT